MYPSIIQGGMGVAISDWNLARAVSLQGQLGVVSGTGLSRVMISRLMNGDPGGHVKRALDAFPVPEWAEKIYQKFFVEGGKADEQSYKNIPMYTETPSRLTEAVTVLANYVEVFLAKEGHDGIVGINLLEKIQLPTLSSLYGAMLAGVDYVLMGAGIPTQIAGALDKLKEHLDTEYRLDVTGATREDRFTVSFSPKKLLGETVADLGLNRPKFLPIISSVILGKALIGRSDGEIDGFVVELPVAGGHNAPPRKPTYNVRGEPEYGPRDEVDLEQLKSLGKPFWLAGGFGTRGGVQRAKALGAEGIQVGSAFALCQESGMKPELRETLCRQVAEGTLDVYTDPKASPTGFPFKVARMEGTMSDEELRAERERVCDLGFLRTAYKKEDGKIGWRCPASPETEFVARGGDAAATEGRTCLCNNLMATAGFPQTRSSGYIEEPIVTIGNEVMVLGDMLSRQQNTLNVSDLIGYLSGSEAA